MDSQQLLERLTALRDSWPAPPWEWDGRFQTVGAAFTRDQEPTVRASAMQAFPRGWTAKSIESAPEHMRAIADRTGGLRAGQRLLGGDELFANQLYGLWWPWGGGDKITLRIGLDGIDRASELAVSVRTLFGVTV